MEAKPQDITGLLRRWHTGDRAAEARLFELLMPDLHRIAAGYFQRERQGHILQATALVNESFLRLAAARHVDWQDRGHFFVIAARIMRRCLIDHARSRPPGDFLSIEGLPPALLASHTSIEVALAVDLLLEELAAESRQRCSVVEMKFFLGMTDEEAADSLGLTVHTFQREWYRARKWLFERLSLRPWTTAPTKTNA